MSALLLYLLAGTSALAALCMFLGLAIYGIGRMLVRFWVGPSKPTEERATCYTFMKASVTSDSPGLLNGG